jgi:uncharacterized membrane protein YbhN (UPF0104 family)
MRQLVSLAVKGLVTAALLYFAVGRANLDAVGDRLSRLHYAWMILAVAIGLLQLTLVSIRWRIIAERCGGMLTLPRAVRFSLIASFFNQVLPSTVGGDAIRIWLFGREGAGWKKATYSVLLDRFVGVLALALIVVATLPWSFDLIRDPMGRITLLIIGFGSVGAGLSFLALGSIPSTRLRRWGPVRYLVELADTARTLLTSGATTLHLMALCLVVHVLTAGIAWSCARAIAAPVGFFQVLLLVIPVILISTIPISIAGWGVRESALVLAFSYAGLAENDGLVISVLFGAAMFTIGLMGGLSWLVSREPLSLSAAWGTNQPPPDEQVKRSGLG